MGAGLNGIIFSDLEWVITKTRPAGRSQTSTVIGGKWSRGTKSNWPAAF